MKDLLPAEEAAFSVTRPHQKVVSSGEYLPSPQTPQQKRSRGAVAHMADSIAGSHSLSRRRFFQTASGMAACFVAMNEVYGLLFDATHAEAQTPAIGNQRARALSDQFIMDTHTHFLRDDTRLLNFVTMREAVGKAGRNKQIGDQTQTLDDLKYDNYFKEIYLDRDTKVAVISNAPSDLAEGWFFPNDMAFQTRAKVNKKADARRMLAPHYTITPGQPGWLDGIDRRRRIEAGLLERLHDRRQYSQGNQPFPRHADDEKLTYQAYEKFSEVRYRERLHP